MATSILVVDADECMCELLRLHLENAGYEASLAEDAVIAGRSLLRQQPQLILADIEMPFMDGLEFVRAVKSDALTSHIPVVVLTGKWDAEPVARDAGAAAFLTKPLKLDDLLATLRKHLKSPGEARATAKS